MMVRAYFEDVLTRDFIEGDGQIIAVGGQRGVVQYGLLKNGRL